MTKELATASLAKEVNAEHRKAVASAQSAIQHAKRCGELLIEAKAACKHGDWRKWLVNNFEASERTARGYMQLSKQWPQIEEQNGNAAADLSLRGALGQLRRSDGQRQDSQSKSTTEEDDSNQIVSVLAGNYDAFTDETHYVVSGDELQDDADLQREVAEWGMAELNDWLVRYSALFRAIEDNEYVKTHGIAEIVSAIEKLRRRMAGEWPRFSPREIEGANAK